MKKLMFVMPYLHGGGAERVAAVLAGEICRMDGYEVHMVTYTRDPELEYPVGEGVLWHSMERKTFGIRGLLSKMCFFRATIRQVRPDWVISLGGAGVIALLVLAMTGLRIPLILSERNDPRNDPKRWYLRMLRSWAYSRCDGVVFQTGEAKAFFPGHIQDKSCVICNPLTGELPPRFEGPRDKRIVTSCRLNAQKNLDLMIDAFSDIAPVFEAYSLHIYGQGEERARLEEKIRTMGLTDRIFLEGYSNHIYDEILTAAMFVSSSDYEGISNSMLEAIALGVPTVSTDCPAGGAREVIRSGVNGLLVPVRDREKLAQAMAKVLSDPELAGSMSIAGEKLRQTISREAVARQWLAYAEQVK